MTALAIPFKERLFDTFQPIRDQHEFEAHVTKDGAQRCKERYDLALVHGPAFSTLAALKVKESRHAPLR